MIEMTISIILATIFVASAISKLRHPRGFVLTVLEHRILPAFWGQLYGWFLPPLEFLLALLLFSGVYVRLTALVIVLVVGSFLVAIIINILRGRTLNCNCFGSTKQRKIGWTLFLQDSLLLGTAGTLVAMAPTWLGSAYWSVFHLIDLAATNSFLPLLICIGLTAGGTALLRNFTRIMQYFKQEWENTMITLKGNAR